MKKERIVRRTLDNLQAGRIDLERVRNMSYEEIEETARADADNPIATDEQLAAAQLVFPAERGTKVPVYIRLDAEVVEHFKAAGPGYQTRINLALREKMQRDRRQRARRASARPTAAVRRPAKAGADKWIGAGPQMISGNGDAAA